MKNNKRERLVWMRIAVCLMFVILILSIVMTLKYNERSKKFMTPNGFELTKGTLEDIEKVLGDKPFNLCSISTNKCIFVEKTE
jgi:hypothetical protein